LREGALVRIGSNIYGSGADAREFRVAGFFTVKGNDDASEYLLARYDYFDQTRPFKNGTIGQVVFLSRSASLNDSLSKRVDEMFANSPAETVTETFEAFNRAFAGEMGTLAKLIQWAGIASLVSSLLAITSSLLFEARGRSNEYALLKVVGFSARRLALLVLLPSIGATIVGLALGMGGAWAFVRAMALSGHEDYRGLVLVWTSAIQICAIAGILAVVAVVPALFASMAVTPARVMRRGT
jgi:putative ABC transport system permease protein